ncbi:MAG: hypothetical protein A3K59_10355 [Euryarchaeota archaeon RBG_19FT_COMBO_69_17]|nr:MAG: hypothetical protein A3K59_10355 [Euryarchaeota archaeon RBG_19FT_COMBO_69_17]
MYARKSDAALRSRGFFFRSRIRMSSSWGNTLSWIVTTNFRETNRESWSVSISSAHTIVRATMKRTSS